MSSNSMAVEPRYLGTNLEVLEDSQIANSAGRGASLGLKD